MKPLSPEEYLVNTVDSFQGNEAGVVVVSLVRNNRHRMPKAFGFLGEDERMNVLFSRAERLLVLVGSWDFFQLTSNTSAPIRTISTRLRRGDALSTISPTVLTMGEESRLP